MWPDPRPLPVRPSGSTALIEGLVGLAMLITYMTEPRSLASRSFTTISVFPHRSTSSFSKCGRARKPARPGLAAFAMSSTVRPPQPLTKA